MKKNLHNKPYGIKLESAIKSERLNANAVIAAQRTAIERINTGALVKKSSSSTPFGNGRV